ncbi:hypothetical protein SDC9_47669 [bioreactor metagenome]|uniref:Uncharacterized protein n=1 Tax=bioreactor metagenome TaxID=1076179 RepID=A0A644WCV8_9ZZZZ
MLNLKKVNEIYNTQEETMEVDLGTYGSLKLRTYLDPSAQESFIDFVCNNVFDGINYYPARKEPLIATAFAQMFVVEEVDRNALLRVEEDGLVIYEVYRLVDKIGLKQEMHSITLGLEDKIDAKIQYLIDRSNADLAGGAANIVIQTVEDVNTAMVSASELLAVLKNTVSQNGKKISTVLTKKNIVAFLDTLSTKLEAAIKDGVQQTPIPRK